VTLAEFTRRDHHQSSTNQQTCKLCTTVNTNWKCDQQQSPDTGSGVTHRTTPNTALERN